MKIINYLSLAVASLILNVSCSQDENPVTPPQGEAENAYATIVIDQSVTTRAQGADDNGTVEESKITHLEIFVFNADNGAPDGETAYYKLEDGYVNKQKITFLVNEGAKNILVAANMNIGEQGAKTYTEVKRILSSATLDSDNSRQVPAIGLPMSGKASCTVIKDQVENYVTIPVSRLVSKLNAPDASGVTVDYTLIKDELEEIFAEDGVTNPRFELLGYAVINGRLATDAFMNWTATDDETADYWGIWSREGKTPFKTQYDASNDISKAYSGIAKNNTWWLTDEGVVYVHENQPYKEKSSGGVWEYERDEVYAMLIKGNLTVDATSGEETLTRYWRINLTRDEAYQIWRNAIYNVNINKITSVGYGNPKDAEEGGGPIPGPDQTGIIATIDIQPWRVFTQDLDM